MKSSGAVSSSDGRKAAHDLRSSAAPLPPGQPNPHSMLDGNWTRPEAASSSLSLTRTWARDSPRIAKELHELERLHRCGVADSHRRGKCVDRGLLGPSINVAGPVGTCGHSGGRASCASSRWGFHLFPDGT